MKARSLLLLLSWCLVTSEGVVLPEIRSEKAISDVLSGAWEVVSECVHNICDGMINHNVSEPSEFAQNVGDAAECAAELMVVPVVGPTIADIVGDQVGDMTTAAVDYVEDNVEAYFQDSASLTEEESCDESGEASDQLVVPLPDAQEETTPAPETEAVEPAEEEVVITPRPDLELVVELEEAPAAEEPAPAEEMKCWSRSQVSKSYRNDGETSWYSILVPSIMRENNPADVQVWCEESWICISSVVEISPEKLVMITYRLKCPEGVEFDWNGYEIWANRKGRIKVCLPIVASTAAVVEPEEDGTVVQSEEMSPADAETVPKGARSAKRGLSGLCKISVWKRK